MKTKLVATLNARNFKAICLQMINWGSVILISMLLMIVSCSRSDDLEKLKIDIESLIIYTDIEPDFTSENLNDFYSLDLNNDSLVDFNLKSNSYSGSYGSTNYYYEQLEIITSSNSENGIISVSQEWSSNTVPLDSDRDINDMPHNRVETYEGIGYFTIGDCYGGGGGCFYDWKDKNDKYVGLRFNIEGKTHYGWARLSIKSVTDWVIKDYAYNAAPNMPILAGQKS